MFYEKELDKFSAIINSKTIISNVIYKLQHDLNFVEYLKSFFDKAINYENLEHMEKYYFESATKDYYKVLDGLYHACSSIDYIKKHSGEEIIEPCMIFNDYQGKTLMKFIGYYSIIGLIYEKIKYSDYFKKIKDVNSDHVKDFERMKKFKLFREKGQKGFIKVFGEDKDFIDIAERNKHIQFRKAEYENRVKSEFDEALSVIYKSYFNANDKNKLMIEIGCQYWDDKKTKLSEMAKMFESIINAIAGEGKEKED